MSSEKRIELIRQIEDLRGSRVICYLTTLRPNLAVAISDDAVREFFDQMLVCCAGVGTLSAHKMTTGRISHQQINPI